MLESEDCGHSNNPWVVLWQEVQNLCEDLGRTDPDRALDLLQRWYLNQGEAKPSDLVGLAILIVGLFWGLAKWLDGDLEACQSVPSKQ